MFYETFQNHFAEFLDKAAVLHAFAGNVERNVGGIYKAFYETHPFGEKVFRRRVYQHFFAVERDFVFGFAESQPFGIFRRYVDERV